MAQQDAKTTGEASATALWCQKHVTYALQRGPIEHSDGQVVVETICSAVSRGTERLVFFGEVPRSEFERMRCPHQEGSFSYPVKYGYALVGRIVSGPQDMRGRTVFALHPHQSRVALSPNDVVLLPEGLPPARAALAANMETALNVVWDSAVGPCDTVLVVGCGVVGLLVTRLLAKMPGVRVIGCDADPSKAQIAASMGATFCLTNDVPGGVDVAINASGTGAGLNTAIAAAGLEARIVEASWLGATPTAIGLGGAFHSQRLTIVSSQVGRLPAARAARWTHRRRLEAALHLLDDGALDGLITHTIPFWDAPTQLPPLMTEPGPLAILLDYGT